MGEAPSSGVSSRASGVSLGDVQWFLSIPPQPRRRDAQGLPGNICSGAPSVSTAV